MIFFKQNFPLPFVMCSI